MELFNSLQTRLETYEKPFKHWAINQPLSELAIKEVCNAEISNPIIDGLEYDGTRAIDGGEGKFREGIKSGGKAKKYRCFVTKDNSKNFPQLLKFINELCSKKVYEHISKLIGKDLSNSYVRLEVICDRKGFWLKPHCDIKEKLLSSLIFVNPFNESENLGTDFYDEKLNKVKTVPYKDNYGYFFQAAQTHGMEWRKKRLKKRGVAYKLTMFHLKLTGK